MSDEPAPAAQPAAYDAVADLYSRAFSDIRVRRDEWRWLSRQLTSLGKPCPRPDVLDIGCGNGALLAQLATRIGTGVGVDIADRSIALARARTTHLPNLRFETLSSSRLPFDDASFDVVISFLSFRYLDWSAIVTEIKRVLRPNGRFLMVDMARQRVTLADVGLLARSGVSHVLRPLRDRRFHRDVRVLTAHPAWHDMLARHPMRAASDYRACLDNAFAQGTHATLNVALDKRVIAFDSGPLSRS